MIHEVDLALRALIEGEATHGTDVEVLFDAPTKDWAGRRNVPTIDVYLYDIREDLRRRERGLVNEYDRGRVTARRLPPRYFKLSYLVTAWTQRPEDEHRLLAALLSCFLRHDALPADLVTGPLADMGLPVAVTVALPPPEDRSFADVWSALGGELKPSLDVVISAPTDTGQRYAAGPPVTRPSTISLGGLGVWPPRETRDETPDRAAVARAAASARLAAAGAATGTEDAGPASRPAAVDVDDHEVPAGRVAAADRGVSWTEFASSASAGSRESGEPSDAASSTSKKRAASTGGSGRPGKAKSAEAAGAAESAEADDSAARGGSKPTAQRPAARARRRRSGGITPK